MKASINYIFQLAQDHQIRIPIILSGQKEWCFEWLSKALNDKNILLTASKKLLLVSHDRTLKNIETVPAEKLKNLLGSEVDTIIWDGFSGLNPSALGAASGLVKGGGSFILCLPELSKLTTEPDPDYLKLCSFEDELSTVNTYFLQGMRSLCLKSPCAILEQNNQSSTNEFNVVKHTELSAISKKVSIKLPTPDQLRAIDAIKKVSQGHRNRPLVISADRGRGKTSALGIAAAQLVKEYGHKIIVTAPNKNAVTPLYKHFTANSDQHTPALAFYAPDQLIKEKPTCHLLMIDEAAAIPNALLKTLLSNYKRIIFATTIHGYEGSGRGFDIRFKKHLNDKCPDWRSFHLKQPIRWSIGDPLETWTEQLLHLRTKDYNYPSPQDISHKSFKWITQKELFGSKQLLEQTLSLLVNAHYQTSPDDIRFLLDHPGVSIGIFEVSTNKDSNSPWVAGVIMLVREGGIKDKEINRGVAQGKRRLRGHLTPQTLTSTTGCEELLALSYLRIVRIAVTPSYENDGYGSQMIQAARKYCLSEGYDFLSSSFGLSKNLIHFWIKNGFRFSKLGTHKDSSTGTYSATLCLSTSDKALPYLNLIENCFEEDLVFGLSRHYRDHNSQELAHILNTSISKISPLKPIQLTNIENFSEQFRSLNETAKDIAHLILEQCYHKAFLDILNMDQAALLVASILQGRSATKCVEQFSLSGKKELNQKLRQSTSLLLASVKSKNK